MRRKYKKISTILNYIQHFLILGSTITGCISIPNFASLVDIPKVAKTKNGRIMLLSKCAVSDSKTSRFIKQQEASGLSSSLK